jgi:hypothetical protein
MLPLLLGLTLAAASAPASCSAVDPSEQFIERKTLHGRHDNFVAVSSARRGDGFLGFVSSQVTIYGANCAIVFDQRFSDTVQTRFTNTKLGKQPILILTTFEPGGSGCGYEQIILAYGTTADAGGVRVVSPMRLTHSNMDGVYVGNLGHGKGPGLVLWTALWEGGTHYQPHRYSVTIYRWRGGKFTGPSVKVTKRKLSPSPDDVAERLGFPFRDQTAQGRFGGC